MSHVLIVNAQADTQAETLPSTPNQTIERTLQGGKAHSYEIKLKAGEYFHVDVDQRGLDVKLTLVGPDGKLITERDSPNGIRGAEALSFIAKAAGIYRLDVKALEEKAEAGKYEIRSRLSRTPTARDRSRIEAETLFQEGLRLSQARTVESVKQACEKYETAAALWRELGEKEAEALTLTTLGYSRESLEENEKAIDAHGRAVSLYRELNDKRGEASGLSRLSLANAYLQKPDAAIEHYHQAKAIFQELNDADGEKQLNAEFKKVATAYVDLGINLFKTGEEKSLRQALKVFAAAREMFRTLEDRPNETLALIFLGRINQDLGNKHGALDFYNQALPLLKADRDELGEGTTLTNIGSVYSSLGFKQKALDHYNQALPLLRPAKDKGLIGAALNSIGNVYSDLGENLKALDYFKQALLLRREAKDTAGEGNTLNNIGAVYDGLGDVQRALDYYLQALPLRVAAKDKAGEAITLSNIGLLHSDLGEHQKALGYYDQALPLVRLTGDKTGEARILNNIGKVYDDLNNSQKALEHYMRALRLWIELEDATGEARTLSNIASVVNSSPGDKYKAKALDYYNRALRLLRTVGDKAGQATALNNIGKVYDDLGNSREALEYYTQALPLLKAVGNTAGEAATFHNMMFAWGFLKNPRLAIFYGKQSVNAYQRLRSNSQELEDKEYQKSFLKTIEYTYRYLAKLLIEQGRLTEAHQVLNGFKDQQYFDFNRATLKKPSPLAMTEREAELSSRYEVTSNDAGNIGSRIEELKRETDGRGLSAEESKRLQQFEADLKTATHEFLAVLKQAETGFGGPLDAVKDKSPDSNDTDEMRAALRELNQKTKQKVVAIYTLVGDDSFQALIITPQDIVPVISPVRGVELNKRAQGFLAQLSEVNKQTGGPKFSQAEVQKTGRELYDLVFAPVAAKLEELNIEPSVLMWSLDGGLRYVPVAALYDGKQYLAERYRNVVFTRAETKRMLSPVSRQWMGAGFYNSKDYSVPVLGEMKRYPGLKNAKSEVETIFGVPPTRGIINGKFLSDDQFTKDSLIEGLRQHHQLIHIASHFRLVPGDASSSFLLLGDGNKLTLADIKDEPDDLFSGVELLTLSACETGAQRERESDGREIDSFAELAQRKGAQAIVASLWTVADQSTSRLMTEFYRKRQSSKLTKAEALQTVQRTLLKDSNYSHPHYWSPFILIGNWR
jgi:CHAT domain-containing protein/predicted negative regulator of RcsB-dependent stress response